MRVISGSARGLKLTGPQGMDTRPTLDRVKEAVFSMLLPYLNEALVLDLFAGSGALGIEALSRGAKKAYFVDNSDAAVDCVKKNVSAARFLDSAVITNASAEIFVENCQEKFDIIFLDPPYKKGMYANIIELIQKNKILVEDGFVVVEWDHEIGFTDNLGDFEIVKEKKYGRVNISVLKWS